MTKLSLLGMLLALALLGPSTATAGEGGIPELFESSFAYETAGNYDRALNDTLQILRKDTGHYIATLRAGWLHYLKASYADSITFYTKAMALKPQAIEPALGLMLPLMAAKQWAAAEKVGEEILSKAPANYLAGSRLAFIYFSQGKYAPALAQYTKVLEAYPSEVEMMLGLGWTHLRMGRKAAAKKMFENVLSIRKGNLNARSGLEMLAASP